MLFFHILFFLVNYCQLMYLKRDTYQGDPIQNPSIPSTRCVFKLFEAFLFAYFLPFPLKVSLFRHNARGRDVLSYFTPDINTQISYSCGTQCLSSTSTQYECDTKSIPNVFNLFLLKENIQFSEVMAEQKLPARYIRGPNKVGFSSLFTNHFKCRLCIFSFYGFFTLHKKLPTYALVGTFSSSSEFQESTYWHNEILI